MKRQDARTPGRQARQPASGSEAGSICLDSVELRRV